MDETKPSMTMLLTSASSQTPQILAPHRVQGACSHRLLKRESESNLQLPAGAPRIQSLLTLDWFKKLALPGLALLC